MREVRLKCFISYAHVDERFVIDQLGPRLITFHDIWYDQRLIGGERWWQTILDEIARCDVFLYVLSPESLASEWCQKEYAEAKRLRKPVITLCLQSNVTLSGELAAMQYVDFAKQVFDRGMTNLVAALSRVQLAPPVVAGVAQPTNIDAIELYLKAIDSRKAEDHETALRLLNEIKEHTPGFLPSDSLPKLIEDSQKKLEERACRREWERQYRQVVLLALDDLTLPEARMEWLLLRQMYPEIKDDPEGLAERCSEKSAKRTVWWQQAQELFGIGGPLTFSLFLILCWGVGCSILVLGVYLGWQGDSRIIPSYIISEVAFVLVSGVTLTFLFELRHAYSIIEISILTVVSLGLAMLIVITFQKNPELQNVLELHLFDLSMDVSDGIAIAITCILSSILAFYVLMEGYFSLKDLQDLLLVTITSVVFTVVVIAGYISRGAIGAGLAVGLMWGFIADIRSVYIVVFASTLTFLFSGIIRKIGYVDAGEILNFSVVDLIISLLVNCVVFVTTSAISKSLYSFYRKYKNLTFS